MMDGVPSKVNVLLQIVSNPVLISLLFFLWIVSNPVLISLLFFLWIVSNPESRSFYGLCPILGHGTKIARGGGNFYYQYESVSLFLTGAARYPGHGTKIARGLDWYNYW